MFVFIGIRELTPKKIGVRLIQKGQKIKAAILFLETLETAPAPYPNSETAFAEAQLPMPVLRHGCGGLPLISEFLRNNIKAAGWLPTTIAH